MKLSGFQLRLGASRLFYPVVAGRRLFHILAWTLSCSQERFPRKTPLPLSFLIVGLAGFAVGFQRGCVQNRTSEQ